MTPPRLAIALACGWLWNDDRIIDPTGKLTQNRYQYDSQDFKHDRLLVVLPDYFNDLNAMHEAENLLSESQLDCYGDWLADGNSSGGSPAQLCHWHASAAQRAEAFLKTLNIDKS